MKTTQKPRIARIIAQQIPDQDADASYLTQDGFEDRLEAWNKGEFSFIGIVVKAELDFAAVPAGTMIAGDTELLEWAGVEEYPDLSDEAHSFADDVDIYTSELVAWLGSHAARPGYCDQAVEEGLVEGETDIVKRIMAGQYLERMEVFHSTIAAAKPYLT